MPDLLLDLLALLLPAAVKVATVAAVLVLVLAHRAASVAWWTALDAHSVARRWLSWGRR